MTFAYKVYKVVRQIPPGKVKTYKEVAILAGNKNAYRAVGNILHKNPDEKSIPCHRVVRSDGALSNNYAFGGMKAQKKRLEKEGIIFKGNKVKF